MAPSFWIYFLLLLDGSIRILISSISCKKKRRDTFPTVTLLGIKNSPLFVYQLHADSNHSSSECFQYSKRPESQIIKTSGIFFESWRETWQF